MPVIPSWINQPDYFGAIRSGTALGQQQSEARDRLGLAYNQLVQNRDEAMARLQLGYDQLAAEQEARQQAAQERAGILAEKLREADALERYRQANLAQQASSATALNDYRQRLTDLGYDKLLSKNLGTEEGDFEPITKELFPESGLYMVGKPGSHGFQILDRNKGNQELSGRQALSLMANYDKIAANIMSDPGQKRDAIAKAAALRDYVNSKFPNLFSAQPPPPAVTKPLTREKAAELLKQAGGDKDAARKLAREQGYNF